MKGFVVSIWFVVPIVSIGFLVSIGFVVSIVSIGFLVSIGFVVPIVSILCALQHKHADTSADISYKALT